MNAALPHWRAEGRHLDHHGHRIFYRVEGQGPALLLIHGYPVGSYDWHAVWAALRPHFTLIAPDMLGHGFSDKPLSGDYRLAAHADMHEALLAHLGIDACHVMAFDLGVSVAQEMLARREVDARLPPITSLILLNGGVCPDAYTPRLIQRLLASPWGPWIGPRVPEGLFARTISGLYTGIDGTGAAPPPQLLADFWALMCHGQGRQVTHRVGAFWRERLALRERLLGALLRSQARLRLINGAADPNSGAHMVAAFLQHRPHADVVSLAGIGHWPQIQAPERVAQGVLESLLRP